MKKIKSKNSFSDFQPIGMAGINKAIRKTKITFEPIEENLIDRIQNFYQQALQSLKVLYP